MLTVDDLPELAGSIPPLVPTPTIRSYAHAVLAGPVVRHAGEAVAGVVAEDRYRAADAAERVRVEHEVLPAATTPASALARGAPRVHPDWPDNLAGRNCVVVGDPDRGFAEAAVVVEGEFRLSPDDRRADRSARRVRRCRPAERGAQRLELDPGAVRRAQRHRQGPTRTA